MITILTWLWAQPGGRTEYTAEHVNIWADMVSRNLSMPHRIACVTGMPEGIDGSVEIIEPPGDFLDIYPQWGERKPNCFRRLAMFRRDAAEIFGERFVCMDIDCVIGGPLDPLFDRRESLVLFNGTAANRPYNGSMMLIKAGCRPKVYERFNQTMATVAGQTFTGSDQAWLALSLGGREKTWGAADGVYWYGQRKLSDMTAPPKILFFPGKIKPWTIAQVKIDPFVTNNYRIAEREAA